MPRNSASLDVLEVRESYSAQVLIKRYAALVPNGGARGGRRLGGHFGGDVAVHVMSARRTRPTGGGRQPDQSVLLLRSVIQKNNQK